MRHEGDGESNFAQAGLETNTHWWVHAYVYFVVVDITRSTARPRPGI